MNRGKAVRRSFDTLPNWGLQSFSGWEPKKLFVQQPDGGFEDTAFADGFDSRMDGRSLAAVDLDNDGDEELLMVNRDKSEPRVQLFENLRTAGNALELQLHGKADGAGALIHVTAAGQTRAFAAVLAKSYATAVSTRVHVGLGEAAAADVDLQWPNGKRERFEKLAAGNLFHLTPNEAPRAVPFEKRSPKERPRPPSSWPTKEPLVVSFVSIGCEPCKREMPELNKLAADGVRILGISTDGFDDKSAAETREKLGAQFEVKPLTEALARSMESMGAFTLPVTVLYDGDGKWRRVVRTMDALQEALSPRP